MRSVLERLNLDIVFCIKTFLNFEDTTRLSLVCRQFHDWLHEESVCAYTVRCNAGHTLEAQEARAGRCTYRQAFERIYKRHAAIASARPYSIRIIAYASGFCKSDGTLSWLSDDDNLSTFDSRQPLSKVRCYDLGNAIRPHLEDPSGTLKLLSCLDEIIAISVESLPTKIRPRKSAWLIIIDLGNGKPGFSKIIVSRKIESISSLFVRQSTTHVAYGFQTPRVSRREEIIWNIGIVSLEMSRDDAEETQQNARLHRLYPSFGVTLGRDVDFAIHGERFYAVSTRMATKLVDGDWTSFYDCMSIAIPTSVSFTDRARELHWELSQIYRRCASDGPINDAWTTLHLEPDEKTDELMIVETRREWVNGSSRQVRSCYVQPLSRVSESVMLRLPSHSKRQPYCDAVGLAARADKTHQFIHHHTSNVGDALANPTTSTKFRSYNLGAKSFVDIIADERNFRLDVSSAADQLIPPHRGMRANITAQGRIEQAIYYSRLDTRSYSLPLRASLDEAVGRGYDIVDDGAEGLSLGDDFTVAADERCIVYMTGSKGEKYRPIVLVSFDPTI